MNNITFENLPAAVSEILEKITLIERELVQNRSVTSQPDQLQTVSEAARFLSLSVPTIYCLVQKREIPFCKKGKRLYFSTEELSNWVKTGRQKTKEEIASGVHTLLKKKGQ